MVYVVCKQFVVYSSAFLILPLSHYTFKKCVSYIDKAYLLLINKSSKMNAN